MALIASRAATLSAMASITSGITAAIPSGLKAASKPSAMPALATFKRVRKKPGLGSGTNFGVGVPPRWASTADVGFGVGAAGGTDSVVISPPAPPPVGVDPPPISPLTVRAFGGASVPGDGRFRALYLLSWF